MCGRFALDQKTDDLIQEFVAAGGDYREWTPSWNIAPTDPVLTIIETPNKDPEREEARIRRLEIARWSLTPSWSKTLAMKVPTFNARAETAAEKATFKAAVRSKRAIIPITGYYEWQTVPGSKTKRPFFIRPADGGTLALAALYSWWADPAKPSDADDRWTLTTTILTSDAVHTLEHIHDRNPVPLPPELWDHWLDPTVVGDQGLLDDVVRAAVPVADALAFDEVGPVKGDGPELIRPLSSPV